MKKIAVIHFPGLNCDRETVREVNKTELFAEIFRWNDDPKKLKKYDGFVIGGGFSYEDRSRAGIIAALDPIMEVLRAETEQGKPCLGICNGAQILVEAGLVPGGKGSTPLFSLAANKRMEGETVVGTGYYNTWVYMRNVSPASRTAFTNRIGRGEVLRVPVAHAEGRFVTQYPDLISQLRNNQQIIFQYSSANGDLLKDFPTNPNGSIENIAGMCNTAGNVMALMPHPERSEESQTFFLSLQDYLGGGVSHNVRTVQLKIGNLQEGATEKYQAPRNSMECLVSMEITDYAAETLTATLRRLGFPDVTVERLTHYEIGHGSRVKKQALARTLDRATALYNPNKERVWYDRKEAAQRDATAATRFALLVRDREDVIGMQATQRCTNRLRISEVKSVRYGTLWQVSITDRNRKRAEKTWKKIIKTHIFHNPHAQDALIYE